MIDVKERQEILELLLPVLAMGALWLLRELILDKLPCHQVIKGTIRRRFIRMGCILKLVVGFDLYGSCTTVYSGCTVEV